MAGVVDADTHIIEHPEVWELLGKELYHRRQVLATTTTDSAYGNQDQSRDAGMVALMRRARTSRRPSS